MFSICLPFYVHANETDVKAFVMPRGRLLVEIVRMPGSEEVLIPKEETWGRAVLTLKDKEYLEAGTDITVRITTAPADIPALYEKPGYRALYSTDISIVKEVGGQSVNIEKTSVNLPLYFAVPGISERTYLVVCAHGKDAAVMESIGKVQGYIGVESNFFSVFTVYESLLSEGLHTGDSSRPAQYILLCIAAITMAASFRRKPPLKLAMTNKIMKIIE